MLKKVNLPSFNVPYEYKCRICEQEFISIKEITERTYYLCSRKCFVDYYPSLTESERWERLKIYRTLKISKRKFWGSYRYNFETKKLDLV